MGKLNRIKTALNYVFGNVAALREGTSDSDADMKEFRKLSGSERDLQLYKYDKAVDMSHYLWQKNPIGRRFINLPVEYSAGTDFDMRLKIVSVNPQTGEREDTERMDAQSIWDEFYTDPINRLDKDKHLFVTNLYVNGELTISTAVNDKNGFVRIGYIDASTVKEIELNPNDGRRIDKISVQIPDTVDLKQFNVIVWDSDPKSPTYGKLIGDVFHFRINYLLGMQRGYPELLESADWIDGLDQFLWNNLEGSVYRNSFFLHEKREGMTQEDLDKLPNEAMPTSGAKKITNEKVSYQMVAPDLKSNDVTETLNMYRQMVVSGKGYPSSWFDSGDTANRATAWSQAEPAIVSLKLKQQIVKNIFIEIAIFVMDKAILAGRLKLANSATSKEIVEYSVSMTSLDKKEIETLSTTLNQTVQALIVAVDAGWLEEDDAKRVVDSIVSQMGIEIDTSQTVDDIKQRQDEGEIDKVPAQVKKIMQPEED